MKSPSLVFNSQIQTACNNITTMANSALINREHLTDISLQSPEKRKRNNSHFKGKSACDVKKAFEDIVKPLKNKQLFNQKHSLSKIGTISSSEFNDIQKAIRVKPQVLNQTMSSFQPESQPQQKQERFRITVYNPKKHNRFGNNNWIDQDYSSKPKPILKRQESQPKESLFGWDAIPVPQKKRNQSFSGKQVKFLD